MANILIFDTETGGVKQVVKSAHTPDFEGRLDILINPPLPAVPISDMVVENDLVREMTTTEKEYRDAALEHTRVQAETQELMNISFDDMVLKLPGLTWALLESIQFTDEDKDAILLSTNLDNFHKRIRGGYVTLAVQKLNEETPPAVDATKWAALLTQVNQIVGL